jgi:solute:Na+ symporter, SSS family
MMPASDAPLLTTGGLVVIAAYLVLLIALGCAGRLAQREKSLSDFYLGGRRLGFLVLLLTLYATQYSGNTLVGFAAQGYRQGFFFLSSVAFMMAIVGIYLIYAPRLHRLSRERQFITLSDYIMERFHSRPFAVLVSLSGIVALGNFIVTNLKAIGFTVELATGGQVTFAQGIIFLALVIVVYETLGGFRSVAWTDVVQGLILLAGCGVIFGGILSQFGGWTELTRSIQQARPDFWRPPDAGGMFLWFSTLLVVGLGIAIYPHAIQRIYAAKDGRTLKRAFQVMVFMPLFTTLPMVMVGIIGVAKFPELDRQASEGITLLMLQDLALAVPGAKIIIVLFLAAVFAAIMSTADSALLSISSMITQDLYRPLHANAREAHLTVVGKLISWLIMAVAVALAIALPQTIWRLIEVKLELLMQIAPALLLGLHVRRLQTQPVFWGFVLGSAVTLFLVVGSFLTDAIPEKPFGMHAGLVGLAVNLVTLIVLSVRRGVPPSGGRAAG